VNGWRQRKFGWDGLRLQEIMGEENIRYVSTDGGLYEQIANPIPGIVKLDIGGG
jgi:hypothetical protein